MGIKPKEFWVSLVEPAFNQDVDGSKLDFPDICKEIDPSGLPQVLKDGKKLKTFYASF